MFVVLLLQTLERKNFLEDAQNRIDGVVKHFNNEDGGKMSRKKYLSHRKFCIQELWTS